MIKSRLSIIAVLLISLSLGGCARDPNTGEYELDYPAIADATEKTAATFTFEVLKYLDKKNPEIVNEIYGDLATLVLVIQAYTNGALEIGDLADTAVAIFERVKERVPEADNFFANTVAGWVTAMRGFLNIAIAAIPDKATMIIAGLGNGLNAGLNQYAAWSAASQTTAGLGSLGVSGLTGGIPVSTLAGTVMP